MTFKDFLDNYLGLIIGVLIAAVVILVGGIYVVSCIALLVFGGWAGRYIQKHKTKVLRQLKDAIDKALNDEDEME